MTSRFSPEDRAQWQVGTLATAGYKGIRYAAGCDGGDQAVKGSQRARYQSPEPWQTKCAARLGLNALAITVELGKKSMRGGVATDPLTDPLTAPGPGPHQAPRNTASNPGDV